MTIDEAVERVVARTRHERYRWLCSEENPDLVSREHYQAQVLAMATGEPPNYPPVSQQAANFAAAIGRAIVTGFTSVDQAEQDRRLAICHECEFFDHQQARCTKCGCFGRFKSWLASERCPIGKW